MFKAVLDTINPIGGNGVRESIVIYMIVGALIYCVVTQTPIDPLLATAFGTVMGWMFKGNHKESEKNE